MISTRLYLDTRATAPGAPAPVKIQITRRGKTALFSTGVRVTPDQWDTSDRACPRIVRHPQKSSLNTWLQKLLFDVQDFLRQLQLSGAAADMSITEIKNAVAERFDGAPASRSFCDFFLAHAAKRSPSTQLVYTNNLKVLEKFDAGIRSRAWRDIDAGWVVRFSSWLKDHYSPNTSRQISANLKAVAHAALEAGEISRNPFAGLSTAYVPTRKRSLTREQLRTLWYYEPEAFREREALDLFRFSFLTIAMNPIDIFGLTPASVQNGRIEYCRSKTSHPFSIKIVPEAEALIARYSTPSHLWGPVEAVSDPRYLTSLVDKRLLSISNRLGLPNISLYWARHTWATLAAELDIPVDVISSALGHAHGARVTLIYIALDQKKVDDAHRKILDYVLKDEQAPATSLQPAPAGRP